MSRNIQTPYVTPHILHKNYAQAYDSEQFNNCEYAFSHRRRVH